MNFFTELSNRWAKDSPKFFKKVQAFGVYLVLTGVALVGVPATVNGLVPDANFDLPLLKQIAIQMVVVGVVIGIVAKLPVKDPDYQSLDKSTETPESK